MRARAVGQGHGSGRIGLALAVVLGLTGHPGLAGNVIGPAVRVNAEVVTSYELDQRIRLMTVLNQPGDIAALARDSLIADRLRHAAAKALGVNVGDAEVAKAMDDFASRGKLTTDQLLKLLDQNGVDAEALRDFLKSGLEWRGAVRAKYAGKISVSEAEIDRAIAAGVAAGGELQVLLDEIFLPDGTDAGDPGLLAERIVEGATSLNAFKVFAQKYSKADSAAQGGALDWLPLSALPPTVAGAVEALKVGEITKPLAVPGGIGIYYLRDESESAGEGKPAYELDIARLALAPGQEAALQAIAARVTACGDLYPVGRGLPEEALQRQTLPESGLPGDLARAVASLDPGETTVTVNAQGAPLLVMLCARTPITAVPASRDAVKTQLLNRKLGLLAEGWLEQMRSDAIITDE